MGTGGWERADHWRGLSRRGFLALVVAGAVAACTSGDDSDGAEGSATTAEAALPASPPWLTSDPFTLGVASGDPLSDRVILWTRLLPASGTDAVPDTSVDVLWEVARDDTFTDIASSGIATAPAALGHSVHVDATGLEADQWYWYRFRLGDYTSTAGRTRTAPAAGTLPSGGTARIAFASCQDYQDGYYTAYPHLVADDPDLVLFLGDYIYEGGVSTSGVRQHNSAEVMTLDDYRKRYALYKSDAGLQAAHAACPWVVTWDDHEVENDYADATDEKNDPPDQFLARRALAYQAFYEHHAVRIDAPTGPDVTIYRDLPWGKLATIFVLDGRQYRSDQPCTKGQSVPFGTSCGEEQAASQTMLGETQRAWLLDGLASSQSVWDVLANQTVMTHLPIGGSIYNFDQWDGYDAERRQILETAAAQPDENLIVVTGDIHAFGVGDLQAVDGGPTVGTEFVGGSISSTFPAQFAGVVQGSIGQLPQIKFADLTDHGYGLMELTETECRCQLRGVTTTASPSADITTLSSWVVRAGTPGATPA